MITKWAGHVEVVTDDDGKTHILYRKDGQISDQMYTPSGFIENGMVNKLIDKLK